TRNVFLQLQKLHTLILRLYKEARYWNYTVTQSFPVVARHRFTSITPGYTMG
ncbi:hypothetical protein CHS0354_008388, partial [Potamilus streckersoni]